MCPLKKIICNFASVKRVSGILLSLFFVPVCHAQTGKTTSKVQIEEDACIEVEDFGETEFKSARNLTWYWAGKNYVYECENIWTVLMPEMPVYKPLRFRNQKEQQRFNRLVYNVKKVLPLAQQANAMIKETYEVMERLPDKKAKAEHIKMVEKDIMKTNKREMKKLTSEQGTLLIK